MIVNQIYHSKSELLENITIYIDDIYNIPQNDSGKQIKSVIDTFIDNISIIVEFPYVEKYYRDTYYNYFSKKHKLPERDSIRLSFFEKQITFEDFEESSQEKIQDAFLGFITIRPTSIRLIGYSFLSPKIIKENNFVTCLCKRKVLICGIELYTHGFPYASQDNEATSCSETVLVNTLDYFSYKFPDYKPLLPSKIHELLKHHTFERQLPTEGINTNSISYVLKELGFGTKVYSREPFNTKNFRNILYTYLESGIPVILILEDLNSSKYHSVLAIGRKSVDKNNIKVINCTKNENNILFSNFFDQILVMNDNTPPYELVSYNEPVKGFQINSLIVPLYHKVFSEAYMFSKYFKTIINILSSNPKTKILFDQNYYENEQITRSFLTTSNSYKNYISKCKNLSIELKNILIDKSMPKFIWVAEIIKGDKLNVIQEVDKVIILDAKESGDSGSLIVAFSTQIVVVKDINLSLIDDSKENTENQYNIIEIGNKSDFFVTFVNNLKGRHTQWES